MREHAILEDIIPGADDYYCSIDTMKRYYVAVIFRCDNCKIDYGWKAVSKFSQFPVNE
jgi:hypothetical protein